eukprot:CAMPEP_0171457020 /NCGR_PEP_ID=MMETSP0945-20130129/3268_1 /TAXON_ID=109269 /ORGANISM="Vaucheria litorea, Strain CCMP2940" /LENGTH=218 /DNA_ID=CAMNT_0011982549 /DNA_START=816 /DNA_END=1472 /DNA_ORIENTATION=-
MVNYRVEKVDDIVAVDDSIYVKVYEIIKGETFGETKMRLSMKAVDQNTGEDLEKSSEVIDELRGYDRAEAKGKKTIELDAVFNTVCSKCGAKGHMSVDCFSEAGQKYDLLTEEAEKSGTGLSREMRGIVGGSNVVPAGRGRGATLPSWMTKGKGGEETMERPSPSGSKDLSSGSRKKSKHKSKHKKKKHKKDKKAKKSKHHHHSKKEKKHKDIKRSKS